MDACIVRASKSLRDQGSLTATFGSSEEQLRLPSRRPPARTSARGGLGGTGRRSATPRQPPPSVPGMLHQGGYKAGYKGGLGRVVSAIMLGRVGVEEQLG
eukprot:7942667-Pyramimonas_sp.AAC.1